MSLIDALARTYGADYKSMAKALDEALAEIDRLRLENAALRAENRHLRRRLKDAELRLLRQAHRDASFMLALHLAGLTTSQRACYGYGISRRHWLSAVGLMRVGHLYERGTGIRLDLDAGALQSRLEWAVQRVESAGYDLLKASTAKNGYSGQHRAQERGAAVSIDRSRDGAILSRK